MTAQSRSISGPIVVAGFLLLTTAGVIGGYFVLREHPKPTDIVDIVNLDGETAVVIREVSGPDERSFTSIFQRAHGERWGAMIPRYPADHPARALVAATSEVVLVRTDASGTLGFFAFEGNRGHKLGRIEPFANAPSGPAGNLPAVGSLSGDGQAFEFAGVDGTQVELFAFDLQTGTIAWQQRFDDATIERAWLREHHIVIVTKGAGQLLLLERDSGKIALETPAQGPICVLPDRVYANSKEGLLAVDIGQPSPQTSTIPIVIGQLAGPCGVRRGLHILATWRVGGSSLLALDSTTNRESWRWHTEGTWRLDDVARHTPDRIPLSGALTRVVLLALDDQLLALDLDTRKVRWRTHASNLAKGSRLMSADDLHYLYQPEGALLAVFEGTNGNLVAARALEGFQPVWPRHIAGNAIWLARDAGFAVIDARTLESLPGQGIQLDGRDDDDDIVRKLSALMTQERPFDKRSLVH